jgi:hypothetical protein
MKKFIIEEDFANAILNYIATKPYVEVFDFVKGFQGLKEVEPQIELKTESKKNQ